ncbi:MAG TPA: alpha/beta hydrolase [Jiangellaceae bacterium]
MTRTSEPTPNHVTSRDGTTITYWTSGRGRPLVLIHGTTADHTRWAPVLPYLQPHVTVHAVDRRGRGGSGDTEPYDIEREYEDVAAVIDDVAASSGTSVDVLGHSFGGFCACGAAQLTTNVGTLALYEGWPLPDPGTVAPSSALMERMNALIADGDREKALELFFRDGVRMPDDEFAVYRTLPAWKARVAAAHTITREALYIPVHDPQQSAKITVPVLMLIGQDSPFADGHLDIAAALPDARVVVLPGQQHVAMDFIPQAFAERVLAFLRDGS